MITQRHDPLRGIAHWLSYLEKERILPDDQLRAVYMSGTHRSLKRKLEDYFGIPTELTEVAHRTLGPLKMDVWVDEVFDDVMNHARITQRQLDYPYPFG